MDVLDTQNHHTSLQWQEELKKIVTRNISQKPEEIYNKLTKSMLTMYEVTIDELPAKSEIKKISYLKSTIRKRAKRSIV